MCTPLNQAAREILRIQNTAALRSARHHGAERSPTASGLKIRPLCRSPPISLSTAADGALTARLVDENLRVAWTIETGTGPIGPIGFEDGHAWTVVDERLGHGEGNFGLVGFPLDRGELVVYAKSKLSRDLTERECQQYLAIDSCDERLAGSNQ